MIPKGGMTITNIGTLDPGISVAPHGLLKVSPLTKSNLPTFRDQKNGFVCGPLVNDPKKCFVPKKKTFPKKNASFQESLPKAVQHGMSDFLSAPCFF